jgi:hypothetical protein
MTRGNLPTVDVHAHALLPVWRTRVPCKLILDTGTFSTRYPIPSYR